LPNTDALVSPQTIWVRSRLMEENHIADKQVIESVKVVAGVFAEAFAMELEKRGLLSPVSPVATGYPKAPPVLSDDKRLTYTMDEAAMVIGISRASAYKAIRRGEIPIIKFGNRMVVPRGALHKLLSAAPIENNGGR
jgi:excisionase family DNA binding protein